MSQLIELRQSYRNYFGLLGISMKVIKVKYHTYEKLGKYGSWSDTIDSIIERLLEKAEVVRSYLRLTSYFRIFTSIMIH